MAYQMNGNKRPGSSYKNGGPGEDLKNKGLTGQVNQSDWWDEDSSKSTMLPEVEIKAGSPKTLDNSSKIDFDSSTDKGIKTLYTGERENTGKMAAAFAQSAGKLMDESKGKPRKHSVTDLIGSGAEPLNYSHGEISRARQQKMDAGTLSKIAKQSSDFLTDPTYTMKKKSGKEKIISKKRHDKLSEKLSKKKNPKRSVSDASIVERIMSKK